VRDALLATSVPELLDKDGDRTLRGLLSDYFAFGRSKVRELCPIFADHVQTAIEFQSRRGSVERPRADNLVLRRTN
jgi:hypothetical protein